MPAADEAFKGHLISDQLGLEPGLGLQGGATAN